MEYDKILIPVIVVPLVVIFMLSIFSGVDDSASGTESETLTVTSYTSAISLIEDHVEEGTESVTNVTGDRLIRNLDYSMDYDNGEITFIG